jgi:hypothetical protein
MTPSVAMTINMDTITAITDRNNSKRDKANIYSFPAKKYTPFPFSFSSLWFRV